jgi:hypothetical protein
MPTPDWHAASTAPRGDTESREVARNGGRESYNPTPPTRPPTAGVDDQSSGRTSSPRLRAEVEERFGPGLVAGADQHRLLLGFPTDHAMRISHETIYLELFCPHESVAWAHR